MTAALVQRLGVAAALASGLVGQAWAHAHLRSASPVTDSIVEVSPAELDLHFSEGLELAFTGLTLSSTRAGTIATGPARLAASDPSMLVVPLLGPLGAGIYTVEWHALSADGHKTQGHYVFSVKP